MNSAISCWVGIISLFFWSRKDTIKRQNSFCLAGQHNKIYYKFIFYWNIDAFLLHRIRLAPQPPVTDEEYTGQDQCDGQSCVEDRYKTFGQQVEAADGDAKADHKDHDDPAFDIEEGERAVLLFLFPFDPLSVLVIESFED